MGDELVISQVVPWGTPESMEQARAWLREAAWWSKERQSEPEYRAAIINAFDVYWAGRPTREDFARTMYGVILQAEMLYQMVQARPHD